MKTNSKTLNKLSTLILELELDLLLLEAEWDSLNDVEPSEDLNESEWEAREEYERKLSNNLDKSRRLILAALDEWNEKCIRFFHP